MTDMRHQFYFFVSFIISAEPPCQSRLLGPFWALTLLSILANTVKFNAYRLYVVVLQSR